LGGEAAAKEAWQWKSSIDQWEALENWNSLIGIIRDQRDTMGNQVDFKL